MAPGKQGKSAGASENPSVTLFREYLRIDTVHPKPDYGEGGRDSPGGGHAGPELAARLLPLRRSLDRSLDPRA